MTLIHEKPEPSVLEFFSLDKIASNATGLWEELGNLTIRYNGNKTLQDMLSVQVHYEDTGQEVWRTQTYLFIEPGWNITGTNVNTKRNFVVTLTYKGELIQLTK